MNFIAYRSRQFAHFYRLNFTRLLSDTQDDGTHSKDIPKKDSKGETNKNPNDGLKTVEPLLTDEKKEAAKKKLLSLLSELKVTPEHTSRSRPPLNLTRAVKRPPKTERFKDTIAKKSENADETKIQKAAEDVAHSVKGDPKKTLAELNEKLRAINLAKSQEKIDQVDQVATGEILDQGTTDHLMSSVEQVASTVPDPPIKSALTERLLRFEAESKADAPAKHDIQNIMKTLTVSHAAPSTAKDALKLPRMSKMYAPVPRQLDRKKINMFDGEPLNLFDVSEQSVATPSSQLSVWQRLEARQLKLQVQFAPTSGFEEMILWTEQGKHWKFPIDNETEMGSEEQVGFHEHVFLEQHLHGFPSKGPVRHFMELVCVGLSKNPYITVQRKVENIDWFREYFKDKEHILRETGTLL